MASELEDVLGSLGGSGLRLRKGTVSAVATGALTIAVDGATFTKVPYLKGSWAPAVNDVAYLLLQPGFGALALGSPVAPAPDPTPTPPTTKIITPTTLGNWVVDTANPAGHWVVDGLGDLVQTKAYASSGAWFYSAADFTSWGSAGIAQVQMAIEVDSGTVQLALHQNPTPTGTLETYSGPLTISVPTGTPTTVNLPLQWGKDLVSGEAAGIVATSQSFSAALTGGGTITLTSL